VNLHSSPRVVIFAIAVVIFCVALGSLSVLLFRRLEYRRQRAKRRREVSAAAHELARTTIPAGSQAAFATAASAHSYAIMRQERYHAAVAGWATSLLVAFTAVALSVTLIKHDDDKTLLAWIDVVALFVAFGAFYVGRAANRRWIDARISAELLRQSAFLSIVFPHGTESGGQAAQATFDATEPQTQSELAKSIRKIWDKRRNAFDMRELGEQDLTPEAVRTIIERRGQRQFFWFLNSRERLERAEERRTWTLLGLYIVAAALAALKVGNHYRDAPFGETVTHALSFVLLMTTGIAAAATGLYFSQNSRSLMHRYRTQQTQIEAWLTAVRALLPGEADRSETVLTLEKKQAIRMAILEFETLMIEELVDWVYITRHDAIEIAP
jgi:hypothetical protein